MNDEFDAEKRRSQNSNYGGKNEIRRGMKLMTKVEEKIKILDTICS